MIGRSSVNKTCQVTDFQEACTCLFENNSRFFAHDHPSTLIFRGEMMQTKLNDFGLSP